MRQTEISTKPDSVVATPVVVPQATHLSLDEDKRLLFVDDGKYAETREKPRLDTMGTGTFNLSEKHRFSDGDFELSPEHYTKIAKYTADGPQDELIIGSHSYFKDVLSVRNANTLSDAKEGLLKGSSSSHGKPLSSKPGSLYVSKQGSYGKKNSSSIKTGSVQLDTVPEFPEAVRESMAEEEEEKLLMTTETLPK